MVDRRGLSGWLDGPGASSADGPVYPGRRLGRPQTGPGSVGRFGRRLVGLSIDWAFASVIAYGLLRPLHWGSFAPLAVLFAIDLVLVGTAGSTLGQRIVGLAVVRMDGGPAGPLRALVRAGLLCLVLPALIWDRDQRGMHDRLAGTLLVRR